MSDGYDALPPLRGTTTIFKRPPVRASAAPAADAADTAPVAATWHAGMHSGSSAVVSLPRLASGATSSALDEVGGGAVRLSHRLEDRRRALAAAAAFADAQREEQRLRSTLMAREYERRHALRWRHHMERAVRQRYDAATAAQRASTEQQFYAWRVQLHEELGAAVAEEAAARVVVEREEAEARSHAHGLRGVEELSREAEALRAAQAEAEITYEDMDGIRRIQMEQMVKYYRAPKLDNAPIHVFITSVLTGEKTTYGSTTTREDGKEGEKRSAGQAPAATRLVPLTLLDEEFAVRQRLRQNEALSRLQLAHAYEAICGIALSESAERRRLVATCSLGACPARLHAILCIQRWWRLSQRQRWLDRHHVALAEAIRKHRATLSAADWRARAARLEREEERGGIHTTTSTHTDVEAALTRLVAAAMLPSRYKTALDYYLFTLTEQTRVWLQCQRHDFQRAIHELPLPTDDYSNISSGGGAADGSAVVALFRQRTEDARFLASQPLIPHRIFPLSSAKHVEHYAAWRQGRWSLGALSHLRSIVSLVGEEAAARAGLLAREGCAVASLGAFATALATHTVAAHCRSISAFLDEEEAERTLVAAAAADEWGTLRVEWIDTVAWEEVRRQPFVSLSQQEAEARQLVEAAEAVEVAVLEEGHWRWAGVARCRQRLATRYATVRGWRLAVNGGGAGAKFVSVVSAAQVVRRFLARVRARHHRAAAAAHAERGWQSQHAQRSCEAAMARLARVRAAQLNDLLAPHADSGSGDTRANGAAPLRLVPAHVVAAEAEVERVADGEAAASGFAEWFDHAAAEPRDQRYREVLARFHQLNEGFLHELNRLLLQLRECRQRIEDAELRERCDLQLRLAYRYAVSHSIVQQEARSRRYLVARESDSRDKLRADAGVFHDVAAWVLRARALVRAAAVESQELPSALASLRNAHADRTGGDHGSNGTHSARMHLQLQAESSPYPLLSQQRMMAPKLTPLERLAAREEVRRVALAAERRIGLAAFLFDFSVPMRDAVVIQEADDRPLVCAHVDCLYSPAHAPVAQLAALAAQECATRKAIAAKAIVDGSASLLVRAHCLLIQDTLWPRFLLGQLMLSSNGAYTDRRLVTLLTQQLGHMDAKLSNLVQLEESARGRIEYLEEITRELRFVHGKLRF